MKKKRVLLFVAECNKHVNIFFVQTLSKTMKEKYVVIFGCGGGGGM